MRFAREGTPYPGLSPWQASVYFGAREDASVAGEVDVTASSVCVFGLLLQFLLSGPLLGAMGYSYTNAGGAPWQKVHPGTIFIIISGIMLLMRGGDPLARLLRVVSLTRVFCLVLAVNLLLAVWILLVSGVPGSGTMVDSELAPPLVAIVLSFAPRWLCHRVTLGFVFLCVINSFIGIGEALLQERLFAFQPTWGVLLEDNFRSSALLGHPLNNAMVTSLAVFVTLSTRLSGLVKSVLIAILFTSLVAFGSRAGLSFAVLGLLVASANRVVQFLRVGRITLLQGLLTTIALLVVPTLLFAGLYLLVHSVIGARLDAASSLNDVSAGARVTAFDALSVMTPQELWFGTPLQRQLEIVGMLGLIDIENPWVVMLMYLGVVGFTIWLATLLSFIMKLFRDAPGTALRLGIIAFLAEASTSDSFGRKDQLVCLIVGATVCASAAAAQPLIGSPRTRPIASWVTRPGRSGPGRHLQ